MTAEERRESRLIAYRNTILNEYFDWMERTVIGKYSEGLSWRKLLALLHDTQFFYILDMDENRAEDGLSLRDRFAYEYGYSDAEMDDAMGHIPCSVLEMMVALAIRCEEHITDDDDTGDRTGKWFFEMIDSLGLMSMDDRHFDEAGCVDILDRFLRREYEPNGRGGLFTVEDGRRDMRDCEIWHQLMRYLNEYIYGGR